MEVVEGVVQEEDRVGAEVQEEELSADLLEGVWAEAPGDEGAEVFAAHVDFDGPVGVEGIGEITYASEVVADGASGGIDAFDDGFDLAGRQAFEALRAIGFARDAVPVARVVAAA